MNKQNERMQPLLPAPNLPQPGYDPEMLFVECSRCGNPIVWEKGRSTQILEGACIDPLELDAHCLLVTDGCPKCSPSNVYHVQIFRMERGHGRLSKERGIGHA